MEVRLFQFHISYRLKLLNQNQMDNTGFVEETIKETKLSEIDPSNMHVNCASHSTKGAENNCKCGAFLIPLCIVI